MSVASVLALAILSVPAACLVGLVIGVRALWRREEVPRFVLWVGYGLAIVGAVVIVGGMVSSVVAGYLAVSRDDIEPTHKARVLAEGISAAMNCSALGLLFGLAGGVWTGFFAWKWRRSVARE